LALLENGDDYFAVNPKGQVPALLLDDGTLLTEGVAIMQYLADSVPDRQLLAPVNSISRYKTIEWLNYIATELHKGFTPLFRPDTPEEYKPTVRAQLDKKLQYVNEALKDEHWICGQRFTIADAYLFTVLRWAYAVKLNLEGLEHIAAFMQRMAERPEVQDALSAEGLK
ncbi:glutathione transferase GstA, partial [Shigella sonnei]|uniref:glutathione transferase GstA n=1 Tax=Shigella sonnei TaxID=624 RepID=UPI0006997191